MKVDLSANFHPVHDFFGGGSINTPKIGNKKIKVTNINLMACKSKKNNKGVFVTDETGLKIFVFDFRFNKMKTCTLKGGELVVVET